MLASLSLLEAHVLTLIKLPSAHHDPFDRVLVCPTAAEARLS
jgi:PIN domain nuclease of toxin-antitoxin system